MARKAIPKAIKESVLREFNHRCAICGKDKPQIHHIDRDHNNNVRENLLPLCPNCHLLDQHDPTSEVDHRKLLLFRTHKDPLILSPQFEPLFRRLTFLLELAYDAFDVKRAYSQANELVEFVIQLQMGHFYGRQISGLIGRSTSPRAIDLEGPEYGHWEQAEKERRAYFEKQNNGRTRVLELAVELLRYQPWGRANDSRR